MSQTIALELLDLKLQESERASLEPGMEGLLPKALKIAISDLVTRISRTIRVNVAYVGVDFRRSELKLFTDGYTATITSYFRNPLSTIPSKPIPIPEGMIKSYPDTINAIVNLVSAYPFSTYICLASAYANDVADSVKNKQFSSAKEITTLRADFSGGLKPFDTSVVTDTLRTLFNQKKFETRLANNEFSDKDCLEDCMHKVLTFDNLFRNALAMQDPIAILNTSVDKIISYFETNTASPQDSEYLQLLYKLVMQCANIVDKYGVLLHEAQRVEHNFTLCLKSILNK